MRNFLAGFFLCLLAVLSLPAWSFDPVQLDFEERFLLNKAEVRGQEQPRLRGPVRDFDFTVDTGTQYDVWLDARHAASGRRSLALKIYSERNENVKDKIELNIVKHNEPGRLTLDEDGARYLGFDFMLDRQYETPRGWALHVQAWQCCGLNPPFAIFVVPSPDKNSEVEFRFVVRDDREQTKSAATSAGKEVYRLKVPRGEWNNMVIRMEPSHNDDTREGRLAMWFNKSLKFDYRGDWGYTPGQIARKRNKEMRPEMAIKVGIYRRRQATTQIIYFDNIRYGTTYDSVAK